LESFDYWSLRRDGSFYLLQNLFEDQRTTSAIFFDTRIVRVTEAVLFCRRLYDRLGADSDFMIRMSVKHGGLKGRELKAADPQRRLFEHRTSIENETGQTQSFRLNEIEPNLVRLVDGFVAPLFELFDFCRFDEKVIAGIIDALVDRMSSR
jgi:hypothetical protein